MKPAEPAKPQAATPRPSPRGYQPSGGAGGRAHVQLPSHAAAKQGHLLKLARLGAVKWSRVFPPAAEQQPPAEDRAVRRLGAAKVAS